MRLNNVNSTKSYRNAMTYIAPCSWKYSILSSTSLLVLEFQQAGTGRAILLTFKRSSIGCRQEYCRETATFIVDRTTSLPLLKSPHNFTRFKIQGANNVHTKTKRNITYIIT